MGRAVSVVTESALFLFSRITVNRIHSPKMLAAGLAPFEKEPDVAGQPARPFDDHRGQPESGGLELVAPQFVGLARSAGEGLGPVRSELLIARPLSVQIEVGKRMTISSVCPRSAAERSFARSDCTISFSRSGVRSIGSANRLPGPGAPCRRDPCPRRLLACAICISVM